MAVLRLGDAPPLGRRASPACATLGSCVPARRARCPRASSPQRRSAQFEVNVRAPEGTSLAETRLIAERIAREIRAHPRRRAHAGDHRRRRQRDAQPGERSTCASSTRERARTTRSSIMDRVRKEIVAKPAAGAPHRRRATVQTSRAAAVSTAQRAVQRCSGPDLDAARRATRRRSSTRCRKVPGAVDVDSTSSSASPRCASTIDRDRAGRPRRRRWPTSPNALAAPRRRAQGLDLRERGEEYDVRVRADARSTAPTREALALMTVPSSRLGVGAARRRRAAAGTAPGPSRDRPPRAAQRQVTRHWPTSAPGVGDERRCRPRSRRSSPTSTCRPRLLARRPRAARRRPGARSASFLVAVGLSFIFMYLVLAAQFESWLHPITILLVAAADACRSRSSRCILFGQSLNIFSMLGILVLFGVVKKNSILQIDHTNHLRAEGMPRARGDPRGQPRPAAADPDDHHGLRRRHDPARHARAASAPGQNRATAGVVVGGQTLSLLLTLLATPVAYSLFDDVPVVGRSAAATKRSTTRARRSSTRCSTHKAARRLGKSESAHNLSVTLRISRSSVVRRSGVNDA